MANPTIGDRMTVEYVTAERRAMPVDEFSRERMGWWDDPLEGGRPMSVTDWYDRADRDSTPDRDFFISLGFDVAPDSSMAAIAIAGWIPDPDNPESPDPMFNHIELVEHMPGTGWLMDRLMAIADRSKPYVVVFDPASPAGSFEKELRHHGFVTKPKDQPARLMPGERLMLPVSSREYAQACGSLVNDVANDRLRHPDQPPLNLAAENGRSRPIAHAWGWDSEGGYDITPLVAVTLAKCGLDTYGRQRKPKPFVFT
jgi:hypothetical protein